MFANHLYIMDIYNYLKFFYFIYSIILVEENRKQNLIFEIFVPMYYTINVWYDDIG